MATGEIEEEQKALNKLIKTRHKNFKSFTYYDYQGKVPEAKEILRLYKEFLKDKAKIFSLYSSIDNYLEKNYDYKHKSMFSELPDNKNTSEVREYIESEMSAFNNNPNDFNLSHPMRKISLYNIKELFGIDGTLAKKLLHTDYLKITEQQKQNLQEWCQYSTFVRRIIKYIKENHPKWDKAKRKEKQSLITPYALLSSEYFSGENASLLQFYPEFIDAEYGLHQGKTAMAKKLLSYNFPQMTLDIAKKITDQSTKNKNI